MATDKPTTEKPKKFNSSVEFLNDGAKPKAGTAEKSMVAVKVKATRTGYYGLKLRHEGDEFTVHVNKASTGRDGKLPSWVEPIEKTEFEVADIPATQETAHLRGDETGAAGDGDGPDSVI